jgi:hypothetical protein
MPYKSDAQRRLFHHLAAQGKIPMSKVREYDAASKGKKLPEFVGHAKKAFGGQIEGKKGVRCPACDYPLDQIPVALDAGEACPRCGYGSAKDVPHKAHGGEIQKYAVGGKIPKYDERDKALGPHKRMKYIDVYNPDGTRSIHLVPSAETVARADREHPFGHFEVDWKQWDLEKDLATRGARSGEPRQETPILMNLNPPPPPPRTPRVGMGDVKMSDRYAHGGEIMEPTTYRARGGEMKCAHCGSVEFVPLKAMGGEVGGLYGDMKELYPSKKDKGAKLDDGKIRRFGKTFADAIKYRRR